MDITVSECSLCHKQLTPYGSKLLKDGIICRDCAGECSPYLTDEEFKEMTVEDVARHLEYRRNNQERLKDMKLHKLVDGKYDLYSDENSQNFLIVKRKDAVAENADIIPLSAIDKVQIVKKYNKNNADYVDIYIRIDLANFQFKQVEIMANTFPKTDVKVEEYGKAVALAHDYLQTLKDLIEVQGG